MFGHQYVVKFQLISTWPNKFYRKIHSNSCCLRNFKWKLLFSCIARFQTVLRGFVWIIYMLKLLFAILVFKKIVQNVSKLLMEIQSAKKVMMTQIFKIFLTKKKDFGKTVLTAIKLSKKMKDATILNAKCALLNFVGIVWHFIRKDKLLVLVQGGQTKQI